MIPITSVAACELLYMLWSLTICPWWTIESGSPVHVLMDITLWMSIGSSVASERQMEAPPWLSLVASTAMPWPWTCPIAAIALPGTLTFQSQCVSEYPAGIEYSESPHWSMSSQTGLSRLTDSQEGRYAYLTWTYTVWALVVWFMRSTSRFQESYQRTR